MKVLLIGANGQLGSECLQTGRGIYHARNAGQISSLEQAVFMAQPVL